MELLLIRHAQSLANVGRCDHCDCDLSELGVGQAQSLAHHLRCAFGLADFKGLVSPYLRARRTAEQISKITGVSFSVHPGCREWGRDCSPVGDLYREETLDGAIGRVADFLASLEPNGRYLIVSHAAPVFMMAHLASGADIVEVRRRCDGPFWDQIANCSITHVEGGQIHCLSSVAWDTGQ